MYVTLTPNEKWCHFGNVQLLHAKRFVCCALTYHNYIIYSMVGWSIASIYNATLPMDLPTILYYHIILL